MNPAYSVILFTTASGAGYGLLALLGLTGLNHGLASSLAFALTCLTLALGLVTVGLLSSTLHLGHPERAWRALSQWRSSWLSREGIAAIVTYPVALIFGASWSGLVDVPTLIPVFGLMTLVMCIITVFCTGKIYSTLKTIRSWNNVLTVPVYLAFALAIGSSLLLALSVVFGRYQVFLHMFAVAALLVVAALKFFYWTNVDRELRTHTMADATGLGKGVRQWEVPHTATNFINKEMGFVVARKHAQSLRLLVFLLFLASGIGYAACLISPWFALVVAPVLLLASWVERWLFFAEAQHVSGLFYGAERA